MRFFFKTRITKKENRQIFPQSPDRVVRLISVLGPAMTKRKIKAKNCKEGKNVSG